MPYEIGALDIGLTKSGEFKIIEAQRQFGNISNPLVSRRVLNAVTGGSGIFGKAIATGFVASALTYGLFSGKDDNYNTIEGLGHKGIAPQLRKENTDFGSGYRGIISVNEFVQSVFGFGKDLGAAKIPTKKILENIENYKKVHSGFSKQYGDRASEIEAFHQQLLESGKAEHTATILMFDKGKALPLKEVKGLIKHERVHVGSEYATPGKEAQGLMPKHWFDQMDLVKYNGGRQESWYEEFVAFSHQAKYTGVNSPWDQLTGSQFKAQYEPLNTAYASHIEEAAIKGAEFEKIGQTARLRNIRNYKRNQRNTKEPELPQNKATFSGRDDAHNTVEGLQHGGWAQRMRRLLTPFGSGWNAKKEVALRAFKVLKVGVKEQLIEMSHFLKKEYMPGLKKFQPAELALTAFTAYEGYSAAEKIYDGEFGVTDALALGAGFAGSKYAYMGWKKRDKVKKVFRLAKNDPELARDLASEAFGAAKRTVGDYVINNKDSAFKTFVESGGGKAGRAAVKERFENTDFIEEFMNNRGDLVSSINRRKDLIERVIDYDIKHKVIPQRNVAFSVMEGMGHTGAAPVERHKLTPFGSKWNALKNLAKGTETLEDIIKSPEFKESLSSAVKGKKLGTGSFGSAFKMTTKFRGQEFSFVRKEGFIGKDEISTMKRFQDDFAPTVYSSGTDKFAKEYIDMELFEGTTLGRATNPEQYVGRAKEALAKMHEQGYSHLDPHKSNIFVTNEGNVGLIDFGTAGKLGESARVETAIDSIYMQGRHGARTKQMDFDVLDKSMSDPGSFGKTAPPSAKTLDEGRRKKRIQQKKIERSQMNLSASKQMSINARNGGKKSNM
jgi:predicted Ser/Thr protein kinase